MKRTYTELSKLKTIEERFEYLRIEGGKVGDATFGFDRYLNQNFYKSKDWRRVRNKVIARDFGCEMGIDGCPIGGPITVHHMNPIVNTGEIISDEDALNPEYLICVSDDMHKAIHYGDSSFFKSRSHVEREPGDTKLW